MREAFGLYEMSDDMSQLTSRVQYLILILGLSLEAHGETGIS
jgi:hypothetical protein